MKYSEKRIQYRCLTRACNNETGGELKCLPCLNRHRDEMAKRRTEKFNPNRYEEKRQLAAKEKNKLEILEVKKKLREALAKLSDNFVQKQTKERQKKSISLEKNIKKFQLQLTILNETK